MRIMIWLSVLLVMSAGCRREVGTCFSDEALEVVFDGNTGIPMYAGQALVLSTCGAGSFCHSEGAERGARYGVPKGLDLDVGVACQFVGVGETCDADAIARLEESRTRAANLRELMVGQVKSKAMPPDGIGTTVRDSTAFVNSSGDTLASIDTKEGREVVRNWIACEAPVIEATVRGTMTNQGMPCTSTDVDVCVFSAPEPVPPDPNWSSIYEKLIVPRCVICHDAPSADPAGLRVLDFGGTQQGAYASMFGVQASTGSDALCGGMGTLIAANDADSSILFQKMARTQTCGEQMPPPGRGIVPSATLDAVRTWINNGAMDN